MDEKRRSGTVKIFNPAGWGFIDVDGDSQDLYFQRDNIRGGRIPQPGDRVSYLTQRTPKGLRAVKVKILDASEATADNWFEFIGVRPIPRKIEDKTTA